MTDFLPHHHHHSFLSLSSLPFPLLLAPVFSVLGYFYVSFPSFLLVCYRGGWYEVSMNIWHMDVYVCLFSCVCASPYIFACAYPGPFDSVLNTEMALKQVEGHRSQLEELKKEESTILHGLGFFKIEQPPSKSIRMLDKVWCSARLIVVFKHFWGQCLNSTVYSSKTLTGHVT